MNDLISDEELQEMEARARAARPGPWKSFVEGRDHQSGSSFIRIGSDLTRGDDIELIGATIEDQDFIAAARSDIPRLIEQVRVLRQRPTGGEI